MPQNQAQKIAIYSRKSRFTGKGESIENQIELCRQYIREHFGEKSADKAVVYEDEGFSGGNLERPRFKLMMADVQQRKFEALVVYRLDRISRNIGDFAKLIEELAELNVSFISIKEQFDTSSPMGRAMMYIASVFSQLERETIAERIRDNMHELAKTGRWLGGTTPTGYESEAVSKLTLEGKTKKVCKLKIVPDEAKLVKLIFEKFLETASLTKIDSYMLENGYFSKNGIRFTRFTLKGILSNPVYMLADDDALRYLSENNADIFSDVTAFDGVHGIMAYNRTIQKAGKANQVRPISEWIVSVGAHEGLISGRQWVKAQKLLEQNSSKAYRKPKSNVALLSGLLYCGDCGDYMRPKLTKRLDKNGEQIYTYLCQTKERSHLKCCNGKNINGNRLDAAVTEEIRKLSEDRSEFIRQLEKSKGLIAKDKDGFRDEICRLEHMCEENEKEIKLLLSSLGKANGSAATEYIINQINELHARNEEMRKRADELGRESEGKLLSEAETKQLASRLASFADTFDLMTIEEKRSLLRSSIEKVVWDGQNVHLYLLGSNDNEGDISDCSRDSNCCCNMDSDVDNSETHNEPLCEYSK